ncbi:MAG: hypothetical protein E6J16_11830 [Chloroflexota bacterium]|nr:MAG: hypothetical protein E6J16_11830 [Chloroflexota bacterium]
MAIDLPKHPVVHGHPIHAILSDGPAVLIPLALAMEAWRRTRKDNVLEPLSRLATQTATAAAAAAAAAVVGWIDWLTIPGDHPAWTPATVHGAINTAGITALAGASAGPKRRLGFLAAATAGLLVAAWIGGDLVFRFGRAKKLPTSSAIRRSFRRANSRVGGRAWSGRFTLGHSLAGLALPFDR